MRRRAFRSLSLLLFFTSVILLACDLGSLTAGKPTVIISSPPHGSQFREGEDIAFQSTATDSSGVTRVELVVDGVVVRTDSAPGPQGQQSLTLVQTWKATQGTHAISVRAYNTSSAASDPASISITVASAPPTPTALTPTVPAPPTAPPPTSVPPTTAPTASSTSTGACTNNAAFVADVTVPDGTPFAPGQTFNKIWRVRNSGTCTWGAGYQLAFVAGEAMATTTTIAVPNTAPGATADLLVAMTASTTPGGHAGQWRLKNSSGALFGTTMSVSINVVSSGGSSPSGCTGTPSIASFTATSTSITAGSSTTLQWGAVTGADSVDIDQGIGGVPAPGNTTVSPGSTTTYTMTAHCASNVATRQVTITVTSAPAAFAVTSVTASVDPPSFTGACSPPKTFNFSGVITTNGAGTVSYRWERSDGTGDASPSSLTFGAAGSQTVTSSWTLSGSGTDWKRIHILSPGSSYSNQATFTLTCVTPNDFSNFTVITNAPNSLTFKVNYHYNGDHGASNIFARAYAEDATTAGVPGSGYTPVILSVGDGVATFTISRSGGTPFTSTQILVLMDVGGGTRFYEETFPYTKTW